MSKGYEAYMPKKKDKKLVQALIDTELHEKVKAILEKEGWSWTEFVTGVFSKFADDHKPNSKRAG